MSRLRDNKNAPTSAGGQLAAGPWQVSKRAMLLGVISLFNLGWVSWFLDVSNGHGKLRVDMLGRPKPNPITKPVGIISGSVAASGDALALIGAGPGGLKTGLRPERTSIEL